MTNLVNKMLKSFNEDTILKPNIWCEKYLQQSINKKWLSNILPYELLEKNLKEIIEILVTINETGEFYNRFPNSIKTPNYGDTWGRFANYIEINNRAIAEMNNNLCRNGIYSSIKILPAIPPSAKSWANCVILSQIFPNIYGDGLNKPITEENSIYGIKLNSGYSLNIIDYSSTLSPEEQFAVFNDLAHLHGLKTGFRTVISADQIKIVRANDNDEIFDWKNHEHQELFIREHVKLIKLGFEAIFIDSAKHIGGYDMYNYTGVGALPEYEQMQYILYEIRRRSGVFTVCFVGEKSTDDFNRYANLGLNTGTSFISPDNYEEVKYWSEKFKYSRNYAPGIEVSNDNDEGGRSYEERLQRINNCLFAYQYPSDKLASFMQMEDLFPLRYDTNTHQLMMSNPSYSTDGTSLSHWKNLFTTEDGKEYNLKVGNLFSHAVNL